MSDAGKTGPEPPAAGQIATSDRDAAADASPGGLRRWIGLGVGLAVLVLVARTAGDQIPEAIAWVEGLGFWGPVAFVGLYALATALMVPGSVLTLAGGALFGVMEGVIWVFAAAVIGSGIAFLIARHVVRGAIESRMASNPRFHAIDRAVGQDGLRMVFLLRLSPVFPFALLNYVLGLTSVRFRDYMAASVGMLPGTLLYVYYGRVIGDVAQLAGGVPQEDSIGRWVVLILGLLATVAVTVLVTRSARAALLELEAESADAPSATEQGDPGDVE